MDTLRSPVQAVGNQIEEQWNTDLPRLVRKRCHLTHAHTHTDTEQIGVPRGERYPVSDRRSSQDKIEHMNIGSCIVKELLSADQELIWRSEVV